MSATGSVLLDTTVVVGYFRQDPDLHKKIERVSDVYMPLAVLGELFYGAYKSTHKARMLAQVKAFLSGCILIQPNETTAELYGQIKVELAIAGKPIPQNDIWIAAAAKQHDLPLATRDQHFSFVSGLALLKW
jgi:tRNA(fMet)-specific endonuclease VapC